MKQAEAYNGLIYGLDREIADWVSWNLARQYGWFDGCKSVGVVKDDKIIAGIVYSDIKVDANGAPHSCAMSIYSVDKKWATKHNLKELFRFPFIQLGLKRVHTVCSAQKGEIMKFNERLGFKQEGYHREAWPMGGDSVSFAMLLGECKWL